jgi:membrane protein YqaA with SNARE-associated domain
VAEDQIGAKDGNPRQDAHDRGCGRKPPFYNHSRLRIPRRLKSFINWIYGLALSVGGPGLFTVAFLDSSFISLPQINDILVVLMVTQNKAWMPYYALMATLGSIAGCYVIYYLAEKGEEAFLKKRLKASATERALALYKRHGLLALIIPGLLPPPAPFKLFVLLAGVAEVRPLQFIAAIAIARGLRYFALGVLAIYYGDYALELMRTRGREVAIWLVGLLVLTALGFWLWQRRQTRATL